jgi:hypothetical protein
MRLLLGPFVPPRVGIHQIVLCNFWIRTRPSPPLTRAIIPRLLWKLVCEPMPTTVFRVALATADSLELILFLMLHRTKFFLSD